MRPAAWEIAANAKILESSKRLRSALNHCTY